MALLRWKRIRSIVDTTVVVGRVAFGRSIGSSPCDRSCCSVIGDLYHHHISCYRISCQVCRHRSDCLCKSCDLHNISVIRVDRRVVDWVTVRSLLPWEFPWRFVSSYDQCVLLVGIAWRAVSVAFWFSPRVTIVLSPDDCTVTSPVDRFTISYCCQTTTEVVGSTTVWVVVPVKCCTLALATVRWLYLHAVAVEAYPLSTSHSTLMMPAPDRPSVVSVFQIFTAVNCGVSLVQSPRCRDGCCI